MASLQRPGVTVRLPGDVSGAGLVSRVNPQGSVQAKCVVEVTFDLQVGPHAIRIEHC
jgi:hypothetical protein